ncbi:hypothetical protein [Nocardia wallacei]|uniref:hypothetical protein n=1 Tax=Nocardia wallacei TaxID=480035 RepID=UPI0024542985|nr:hypothetical protein [Nocardia wallacei]
MINDPPTDEEILEAVKREFLDGVMDNVFPPGIASFSDLHDYTDANMIADELTTRRCNATGEIWTDLFSKIQERFTAWLHTTEAEAAIHEVIATKAAIPAAATADRVPALSMLYAEEIQALESAGWESVHPVGTGGGCTAIEAHKGQRYLLATDGDHALVRGRDDEQSTGWLLSLYDIHREGDAIAYAEAPTLMSALTRALAAEGT